MKYYLLLLPLLFFSNCRKETDHESLSNSETCRYASIDDREVLNDQSLNQDGYVPMHFNNYWVYTSQYWNLDGSLHETRTDSIYVVENMILKDIVWWRINLNLNLYPFSTAYTSQIGDTLFGLSCSFYTSCVGQYKLYTPISKDTTSKSFTISCDIGGSGIEYVSDSSIVTPSGNFTDCYVFEYGYVDNTHIDFLKPGIGPVKCIYFTNGRRREITLIDYHIES